MTSETCCFSKDSPCPNWYLKSLQPQAIEALITSERMVWLLAIHDNNTVGILAVEDKSVITYFFVHPQRQKMGIGKRLWQFAMGAKAFGPALKVRSSLFAVPVYERLGFKAMASPSSFNGLAYQTMVAFTLSTQGS